MLRTAFRQSSKLLSPARVAICPALPVIAIRHIAINHSSPSSPFSRLPSSSSPVPKTFFGVRSYSAGGGPSKEDAEARIVDLLKGFDKITDASKISSTSHFSTDLGLDSLDVVEVVMAIEEEFSIEIPDKEADKIQTVDQAVTYILEQPNAV